MPIAFERTPSGPSAFVDFPPPAGTAWAPLHLINHGCDRVPLTLPKCPATTAGEPWSALAPKAAELRGVEVSIQDRLVVGSRAKANGAVFNRNCDPKWKNPIWQKRWDGVDYPDTDFQGCLQEGRAIVLGDGDHQLGFAEDSPAFDCIGDQSRLCCGVQAFGQTVVAQGILDGSEEHGWVLKSASVCELPATAPQTATVQQRRN